ncbi:MAG: tripartite tricarboxylate transporter substrate binding protein [Lautropia sp.]
MRAMLQSVFIAVVTASAATAFAAFPERPVKIVVPFPAGGAADLLARRMAAKMGETWGQPVIVDNKPGAAAALGAEFVARSNPDGYTLLLGTSSSHSVGPAFRRLSYDPIRDFEPVTQVTISPLAIALHPAVPANSVRELIDYARANPGRLSYASWGNGSASHLAAELFKSMARIDIVHVPYKGSPPALADLMAAQVQLTFDNLSSVLPHVRSGKLKLVAVTTEKRAVQVPDTPTVGESLPGFAAVGWFGLFAPAGTPREIAARVNVAAVRALQAPEVGKAISEMGMEVVADSAQRFGETVRTELEQWSKVVKDSGARPD